MRRLAVLALPLAIALWIVMASGLARTLQSSAPEQAGTIWPWNAGASVQRVQRLAAEPNSRTPGELLATGRRALALDASQPLGYAALAIAADLTGDERQARTLFNASQRFSRRVLIVQIWLIQDAVAAGNVAGALRHFDIALRVSGQAPAALFPVLTGAAADPNVQGPLAALLATRPLWRDAFLRHAATNGDPAAIAALMARGVGSSVPEDVRASLSGRLVAVGRIAQAFALAGGRRTETRVDLARGTDRPAPFDWTIAPTDTTDVSRDTDGSIHAETRATVKQLVASRVLALAPGRYRLVTRGTVTSDSGRGVAGWSLACMTGTGELTRMQLPAPRGAAVAFTVPASCPFQRLGLDLVAATSDGDVIADVAMLRIAPFSPEDRP